MGLENIIAYLWCTKAIYNKTSREKSLVDVVIPLRQSVYVYICMFVSFDVEQQKKFTVFFVCRAGRAL